MAGQLLGVRLGVGLATLRAFFFGGEEHRADRAARDQAQAPQRRQRLHDDRAAGAVVLRPFADVPRIDVRADDDDLVGQLAAAQLGEHIEGWRVGARAVFQNQVHRDRAARGEAGQQLGVLDGQRGGRDLRSGPVVHLPGVRRAEAGRRQRANERRDRAQRRRPRRPLDPVGDRLSVAGGCVSRAREGVVEEDDLPADRRTPAWPARRTISTTATSAVSPPGGVATVPPRPSTARRRGAGVTISADSLPRCQIGTRTGSSATFSCPSATKASCAQTIARSSAGEPVIRGPNWSASAATRR